MMSVFKYFSPGCTLFGFGCIQGIRDEIRYRNLKKAFVVTDHKLRETEIVKKVTAVLASEGTAYCLFSEFKPNPTTANINCGAKEFVDNHCDFLISVGGGSAHDCAKAISVVTAGGGKIEDYRGSDKSRRTYPLIAVTTTAGTGSECTLNYVVVDEKTKEKYGNGDRNVLPVLSVDDIELMMDMPASLTAGTGMDALTHAVEAYCSEDRALITSELAAAAVRLIFQHLENATLRPDQESREGMSVAQFLAGLAFGNAGCGLIHSMSHQLSAVYDLPHGLCNAVLMPVASRLNMKDQRAVERYALLGRSVFPLECSDMEAGQQAEYLIDRIEALSLTVGTKKSLTELGVREEDIPLLAEKTLHDASLRHNIYKPDKTEIEAAFRSLM
ncbi:iron-containing alcohol dehydrogenase [Enterocloster lavalensis]|uniref:iron-containing alcohol dehydrogenase n=1 Tax=Enterocloster lavalensis TaxID=460384 RepID=UPI00266565FC|nr:iron-containing alcohol dehydrogenase [Enterocloster lavalensis]